MMTPTLHPDENMKRQKVNRQKAKKDTKLKRRKDDDDPHHPDICCRHLLWSGVERPQAEVLIIITNSITIITNFIIIIKIKININIMINININMIIIMVIPDCRRI